MPKEKKAVKETVVVQTQSLDLSRKEMLSGDIFIPENSAVWYLYSLRDKKTGSVLLTISVQKEGSQQDNVLPIGKVISKKPGNIWFFGRMMEMMRQDARKENPKADIVDTEPTDEMRQFYRRRFGARTMRDGYIHFPEKMAIITRSKSLKRTKQLKPRREPPKRMGGGLMRKMLA